MGLVCITVPDSCDVCYSMELATASSFNIPAGLTPGGNYFLFVIDKFQKTYSVPVVINADGSFDIHAGDYPDGFWSPYSGPKTILLATDDGGEDVVTLHLSVTPYNCVNLTITECPAYANENDDSYYISSDNNLYQPE